MRDNRHLKYINALCAMKFDTPENLNKESVYSFLQEKGVRQSVLDYLKASGKEEVTIGYKKLGDAVETVKELADENYLDAEKILFSIERKYAEATRILENYDSIRNEYIDDRFKEALKKVESSKRRIVKQGVEELTTLEGTSDEVDKLLLSSKKKLKKLQNKNTSIIAALCLPIAIACFVIFVFLPNNHISKGKKYLAQGMYDEAIQEFESANSTPNINEAKYQKANMLVDNGNYNDAEALYKELSGYKDCNELLTECSYLNAINLLDNMDYEKAATIFKSLNDYKDSNNYMNYSQGLSFLNSNQLDDAYSSLSTVKGFKNSDELLSTLIPVPETINYDNEYTFTFTYSSEGVMQSALTKYSQGDTNKYSCNQNGQFTTMTRNNRHGTQNWVFTYETDGSVKLERNTNYMRDSYDRYGMLTSTVGSSEITYPARTYDKYHNPTGSDITNIYDNDLLVKVEHAYGNLLREITFSYKVIKRSENCDLDSIWKNIRIVAGDDIW